MKIIIVSDKQASEFLSNPWNIGAANKHTARTGNIADGFLGLGRFKWNGEHWEDEFPIVVVHNRQVTKISEVHDIIGGLLLGKYETVVIGCDPSTAPYLTRRLREVFGSENITEIYPYLGEGFEEYKDLGGRIKKLLDLTTVGRVETGTDGPVYAVESRTPQKKSPHLKVTLVDTENDINIILDPGVNIELDLSGLTQDTA